MNLKRLIRKDLKILRTRYKSALRTDKRNKNEEWINDNFYMYVKEGENALIGIKKRKVSSNFFNLCKTFFVDGKLKTIDEIITILEKSNVDVFSLSVLKDVLKLSLIDTVAKNFDLIANTTISLSKVSDIDIEFLIRSVCSVDKVLRCDPMNIYDDMDEKTRNLYRYSVQKSAFKLKMSGEQYAKELLKKAKEDNAHIGEYLNLKKDYKLRGVILLIMLSLVPAIIFFMLYFSIRNAVVCVLLYFPVWEFTKIILSKLFLIGVPPTVLPSMDSEKEIPDGINTMIVVCGFIPTYKNIDELFSKFLKMRCSQKDKRIKICLLCDFKSADSPVLSTDESDIEASKKLIDRLNNHCDGGFLIAVRSRSFSKTSNEYCGFERKRGALMALVSSIKENRNPFKYVYGDVSSFYNTKYIIALDSDTILPLDCSKELISVARHPLNRPVIDETRRIVTRGYGVLTPKIETDIESAYSTAFCTIMVGASGVIVYNSLSGDLYQDLFNESIFSGKGIIDVDAFYRVLNGRFKDETVLSHDILEGNLLRTGFVSNICVYDSFPSCEETFLSRFDRWSRGDAQNISFIFEKKNNPINFLSRYKLFDNIRRNLNSFFLWSVLLFSLFLPSTFKFLSAIIVLVLIMLGELIFTKPYLGRRFLGKALPAFYSSFFRALLNISMLAQNAYVSIRAFVLGIYRRFISKKNMLSWVTAAQSEKKQKFLNVLLNNTPSLLSAALLLIFGSYIHWFFAFMFLINPLISYFTSKTKEINENSFNMQWRDKLTNYASCCWKYYENLADESNNYLPPDNIQQTPKNIIAHRTSPTNIGFMLICTLSARDFGFIDTENMCQRLSNSLNTVLKLEKYEGNLLNWYDTKTLKPLIPKYVSSVDSGNFLCMLTTLISGLNEYKTESKNIENLIDIIQSIIDETNLAFLYNKQRKLFYIGYNVNEKVFSNSYYDLLMSEARMTGYFAIATGQIPKSHWAKLGRIQSKMNGYAGPLSWTGTMFEYYMPQIFLPCFQNSLTYEALKFCFYCQKYNAKKKQVPFGISESGFFEFDSGLQYQYKAHGIQELALRRGMDKDTVISPYSTFLVLPFEPGHATDNLKELEEMQLTGVYGFYEAADFTDARVEGQEYAIVKSFMAHHVGMSMLSIQNALNDKIMQKRFMHDKNMAGAVSLLCEKATPDTPVFKDEKSLRIPQRPKRYQNVSVIIDKINEYYPKTRVYTNGEWTSILTDSGLVKQCVKGVQVLSNSGFSIFLSNEEKVISLSSKPSRVKHTLTDMTYYYNCEGISAKINVCVHPRIPGEQRTIKIKNTGKTQKSFDLYLFFEPILFNEKSFSDQIAFSKLSMESTFSDENKIMLFNRLSYEEKNRICLAAGFFEQTDFDFGFSRRDALTYPFGQDSLSYGKEIVLNKVGVPDNMGVIKKQITLQPKESMELNFLMVVCNTISDAEHCFINARRDGKVSSQSAAPSPFIPGGLDEITSMNMLAPLLFNTPSSKKLLSFRKVCQRDRRVLFEFSISGNNPLIYIEHSNENISTVSALVRMVRKLKKCNVIIELIISYHEKGEYNAPIKSEIMELLAKENAQSVGEIHVIDLSLYSEETAKALIAFCDYYYDENSSENTILKSEELRIKQFEKSEVGISADALIIPNGFFSGSGFYLNEKPKIPWCTVLANKTFGTLITDKNLGYTWALNSRENKLTMYNGDACFDSGFEKIFIEVENDVYDACLNANVKFSPENVEFFGACEKFDYKIDVWINTVGMTKSIEVSFIPKKDCLINIFYLTRPVMSKDNNHMSLLKSKYDNGIIVDNSNLNDIHGFVKQSILNEIPDYYTCSFYDVKHRRFNTKKMLPDFDACIMTGKKLSLKASQSQKITFLLSYSVNIDSFSKYTFEKRIETEANKLHVKIPDKAMNPMINTWLLSQIRNSRIDGRTGFYQCSGAFGFRDQLQDVSALILLNPKRVREHLINCAAKQFVEGDVMHWWHQMPNKNGTIKGIRTRCSDDLLWLTAISCEYAFKTGDYDLFNVEVPYLNGEELLENERERYFEAEPSSQKETILKHCMRAVHKALDFGEHGLLLIKGGDWNDGFSKVGENNRGESVWLSEFLSAVLPYFADVCDRFSLNENAQKYRSIAETVKSNIDKYAFEKGRYIRAFYDDGTPMEITDSIAQSFAVFSKMSDRQRVDEALKNAYEILADKNNGVIKLFTPAFEENGKIAGYINSYARGVRENGGQYTHAAVWFAGALIMSGYINEGYELMSLMNPIEKYLSGKGDIYKTEPFALTADVYSNPAPEGMGGWSLYTGAAAWYYKVMVELVLGIRQKNGEIYISPLLPNSINGYSAKLTIDQSEILFEVKNKKDGVLFVDGEKRNSFIPDGNNHKIIYE